MQPRLHLQPSYFKAHGHGNDYLVFDEGPGWELTPGSVRAVCHRQRGVGGDGIVALLSSHDPAGPPPLGSVGTGEPSEGFSGGPPGRAFRARMFNPDGTEFERSGNGLRILGAHLYSLGRVEEGKPFPVEVGGEVVTMEIIGPEPGGALDVAVDMGEARFGMVAVGGVDGDPAGSGRIPHVRPERGSPPGEPVAESPEAGFTLPGPHGEPLDVQPVSVGNPHCVVFRDSLREQDLLALGPFLATNPLFPAGVNVQMATVVDPTRVDILIWERGVGRTDSSGTSACAVASACVHQGRLPPGTVQVCMEGGSFQVTVSPGAGVRLRGPVQPITSGSLSPEMLERLG